MTTIVTSTFLLYTSTLPAPTVELKSAFFFQGINAHSKEIWPIQGQPLERLFRTATQTVILLRFFTFTIAGTVPENATLSFQRLDLKYEGDRKDSEYWC